MNKQKYILIAVVAVVAIVCAVLFVQPRDTESVTENTIAVEESREVEGTTTTETDVPEETEVRVVESTPDSITMVVPGENGEDIKVQIGVDDTGKVPDEEDGEPSPTFPVQDNSSDTKTETTEPTEEATEPTGETTGPTTEDTTEPTEGTEKPTTPPSMDNPFADGPDKSVTYAEYEAMSAQEQLLFFYSFADAEAFQTWYNAAKAEHEANSGDIIIGSNGVVTPGGND